MHGLKAGEEEDGRCSARNECMIFFCSRCSLLRDFIDSVLRGQLQMLRCPEFTLC